MTDDPKPTPEEPPAEPAPPADPNLVRFLRDWAEKGGAPPEQGGRGRSKR